MELPPIPASPPAVETSPSPGRLLPSPGVTKDSETDYSDMEDEVIVLKPSKPPEKEKEEKNIKQDKDEGMKREAANEGSDKGGDENPTSVTSSWILLQPGGNEKPPNPQPSRRSGLQALKDGKPPPLSGSMPTLQAHGGHMPLRRISGSRSPSPDCAKEFDLASGPGAAVTSKDPPAATTSRGFFSISGKKKTVKKESKKKEKAKSPRPDSKGKDKDKGKDTKPLSLPNGAVPVDEKAGLKKTLPSQKESISDITLTIEADRDVDQRTQEESLLTTIKELSSPEVSGHGEGFDWTASELDSSMDFSSPQLSPEKGTVKRTSPPPEITGNIDSSASRSQTKKNKRVVINPNLDQRWNVPAEQEEVDGDEWLDQRKRYRARSQTFAAQGGQKRKQKPAKKGGNRMLRRQSSFSERMRDREMIQMKNLELFSPDVEARIRARVSRAIGEKYGGIKQASESATTIQRAYRDYKLKKRFEEIRQEASKMRKRAETMQPDSRRRLSVVRKRQQDRKDPLLRAREAAVRLSKQRSGYTSARKQQVRQSLAEFPILESSGEMSGDMETAVCVIPIGYDSDSEERPKLKFQISGTTTGESTTDPSLEASKPSAFSNDKHYRRHRPSVFSLSVSADDLEQLRQKVEKERAVKKRKYSQTTLQQKTSVGVNHFNRSGDIALLV